MDIAGFLGHSKIKKNLNVIQLFSLLFYSTEILSCLIIDRYSQTSLGDYGSSFKAVHIL